MKTIKPHPENNLTTTKANNKILQKGSIIMKGSKWQQKDGRWVVGYYWMGKQYQVGRYNGEPIWHPKIADKLIAALQKREEEHKKGTAVFRIEEFTDQGWTDTNEYYKEWMKEVVEPKRKPATIKGYWSYYRNWIKPFFDTYPVRLHEIQLDTLTKFLNYIDLTGKGKSNVMMALHSMMDYAWRSKRIPEMPPFPRREDFNIVEPVIKWLPEERQMAIINAIPEEHRQIFLWLKYHLRRPSEACALKWMDFDTINHAWIIRRTISARKEIQSTKTGNIHVIRNHPEFCPGPPGQLEEFVFKNKNARHPGARYTNESLNNLWKTACRKVGETIDLYSGLKHSSCSQYINEYGLSIYDIQTITDHKRLESVRKYAKAELSRQTDIYNRTMKKKKFKVIK